MRSTKIIQICSSSLCTCLHHMVILRTRNKITDFLMILAWASPFNVIAYLETRHGSPTHVCALLNRWGRVWTSGIAVWISPGSRCGICRSPYNNIIFLGKSTSHTCYYAQQTQNICITLIQCWANVSLGWRFINVIQMFCVCWLPSAFDFVRAPIYLFRVP